MEGHPVQIITTGGNHEFDLDEEKLREILLNPKIQDKKVAVISVAGAFRKGKSFILNFFLRYLSAKVCYMLNIDTYMYTIPRIWFIRFRVNHVYAAFEFEDKSIT